MERYSIIRDKMPREFVLLQGTGCKWRRCEFCDYHSDVSDDPFEVNRAVLEQVTGEYGVLDVINSGSAFELDDRTIEMLRRVIEEKKIHTLWCEMHWMYRNRLEEFRLRITDDRLQITDLTPSPAGLPLKQGENTSNDVKFVSNLSAGLPLKQGENTSTDTKFVSNLSAGLPLKQGENTSTDTKFVSNLSTGFSLKQGENMMLDYRLQSTDNGLQMSDTACRVPTIKFRCGIETFDPELRKRWNKGVPESVTAEEVARYFQGVCLLCCTEGETRERIVRDIELARKHFEYFSVNVFCNNTTKIKRDPELVEWFVREVYPTIKDDPSIEVLIDNTDLGVG